MIKRAIQYTIQKDRNRMKLKTKKDMFKIWLNRVPQIFEHSKLLSKSDIIDILDTEYDNIFFDKNDILNSFMLFECLALAPGRFFERNDKFAMNFSMEGRYPFASKKYMENGATILGGCCEIRPSHIKEISKLKLIDTSNPKI